MIILIAGGFTFALAVFIMWATLYSKERDDRK